jgi:U3 small nucleolar RNA-associated protein 6
MAEHVQASLDQMVAPLRDLMDRNIFSDKEIRSIVSRRRESEYLLRRRAARKADFIRYIDAEMILEKLRSLRTAKKKRDHRKSQREKGIIDEDNHIDGENGENDNDNDKDKQKDHIGDIHIVQHIHLLFVRVIRKFRGDISLHLRHATFCKDVKSYTRLGRVYAEALQIFPRESGLWIEAASNEFFGQNRSVKGARVLLQRSLRINERNQELWLQYFTLELHYAQTLKGRQRILHP